MMETLEKATSTQPVILNLIQKLKWRPENAPKLRELVLQMAVQGKLTNQWRNENPDVKSGRRIVEEIKVEKVKSSIGKKDRKLSVIEADEIPLVIPENWEWTRFGDLIYLCGTGLERSRNQQSHERSIAYLKMNNIVGYGEKQNSSFIRVDAEDFEVKKYALNVGDFLFNTRNSAELVGKSAVVSSLSELTLFNNNILRVVFFQGVNSSFMNVVFWSIIGEEQKKLHRSSTTNVSAIYNKKLFQFLVCIPPLEEQKEIVRQVDVLMAEIDKLEQQGIERIQLKNDFVASSLHNITITPKQEAKGHWELLRAHFSDTITDVENVKKLRETILQLAVQGKLTRSFRERHPELVSGSNSAQALLDKIKEEKLIALNSHGASARGKRKKEKPLPPINPNEIPFEIPESWIWCRLGDIAQIVRGGSPRPAGDVRFYEGSIPFLKVADLTGYEEKYCNAHTHSIKEAGLKKTRLVGANTLLLTNSGATLGIPRICSFETTFNDGIAAFLGIDLMFKEFLFYFLKSKTRFFLEESSRGQGQPNLNTDIIKETLLSLPSFQEQKEIVKVVDALMGYCDELEQQLNTLHKTTKDLVAVGVQEVLK